MKVLFISHLRDPSASGRQRLEAFEELGHEVVPFSLDGLDRQHPLLAGIRRRVIGSPYRAPDQMALGQRLASAVAEARPDLVWAEKPLMLLPQWLTEARALAPQARFVCFQDDDPFGFRRVERNLWRHFTACIPLYDAHFVKKQVDALEFKQRGAKNVLLFMHGVHERLFHPPRQPAPFTNEVTFVGTPLDHRVEYIEQLLNRHAVPLKVYGNQWNRRLVYWRRRDHFHREVVGCDYADLLRRSSICLGFVSSSNRDEYSMRTFEIPGCAAFLLAERTPAHEALFKEGAEAEFFSSVEECADKCSFYLRHDGARRRIARAGYERCRNGGYLLHQRIADALKRLDVALNASVAG